MWGCDSPLNMPDCVSVAWGYRLLLTKVVIMGAQQKRYEPHTVGSCQQQVPHYPNIIYCCGFAERLPLLMFVSELIWSWGRNNNTRMKKTEKESLWTSLLPCIGSSFQWVSPFIVFLSMTHHEQLKSVNQSQRNGQDTKRRSDKMMLSSDNRYCVSVCDFVYLLCLLLLLFSFSWRNPALFLDCYLRQLQW